MSKKTIFWFSILFSISFMFSTGMIEFEPNKKYGRIFDINRDNLDLICITSIIGLSTTLYYFISFINNLWSSIKTRIIIKNVIKNGDDLVLTDEEKRLWGFVKETYGKTEIQKNQFIEFYRKQKTKIK